MSGTVTRHETQLVHQRRGAGAGWGLEMGKSEGVCESVRKSV